MSREPFDKAEVIERSLRCYMFGLVGLLPGIGIPFAVAALYNFLQIRMHQTPVWNPANRHLTIGALCALGGLGLTLQIVGAIIIEYN